MSYITELLKNNESVYTPSIKGIKPPCEPIEKVISESLKGVKSPESENFTLKPIDPSENAMREFYGEDEITTDTKGRCVPSNVELSSKPQLKPKTPPPVEPYAPPSPPLPSSGNDPSRVAPDASDWRKKTFEYCVNGVAPDGFKIRATNWEELEKEFSPYP